MYVLTRRLEANLHFFTCLSPQVADASSYEVLTEVCGDQVVFSERYQIPLVIRAG
jgi:hypothetical protein